MTRVCEFHTPSSLAVRKSEGYVELGGPYLSATDCLLDCGITPPISTGTGTSIGTGTGPGDPCPCVTQPTTWSFTATGFGVASSDPCTHYNGSWVLTRTSDCLWEYETYIDGYGYLKHAFLITGGYGYLLLYQNGSLTGSMRTISPIGTDCCVPVDVVTFEALACHTDETITLTPDCSEVAGVGLLRFNGVDQYVEVLGGAAVSTSYSVSCWVKIITAAGDTYMVSYGNSGADGFHLGISPSSGTEFSILHGNVGWLDGFTFALDTWYHVVATYDGTTAKLYVNGSEEASGALGNYGAPTTGLFIGRRGQDGGYINADIDAVRIYDRDLSAGEITEIYGSGNGLATAGSASANLVAWWKFDEASGGTATDSAGSNDGTLANSPTREPSAILG